MVLKNVAVQLANFKIIEFRDRPGQSRRPAAEPPKGHKKRSARVEFSSQTSTVQDLGVSGAPSLQPGVGRTGVASPRLER